MFIERLKTVEAQKFAGTSVPRKRSSEYGKNSLAVGGQFSHTMKGELMVALRKATISLKA
jgi:hypothetical protein